MDRLWTDFVNSDYHDWRGGDRSEDRLGKASWQQDFLNRWQLEATVPASSAEESTMRSFRDELQSLAIRMSAGDLLTDKDQTWLNDCMQAGGVTRKLILQEEGLDVVLVPMHAHWQQVIAEVAADFAMTLLKGEGQRIRSCDNPDCRWIFYDDTRSRTQKYCDDKMCGNLMKVRRFRAKRKQATSKEPGEKKNEI
ncbi:CGNR zinc finger domain-containing protein [Paenibacillus silvae]|uniref:CGNR zinc finger domain-containing protein n=1 Tax=Paenibacillus silvae TaxID=1325358 RepID=UPI002005927F|nr:CGNR zinc finger domain-containing protein [Paenibacillus silvae]MCK6076888.1 CGNR zinc finger domain-containing protein [Paenibacillus silvae]MCK6152330.1 CGNR zinc finger domain-containing protein [Paenibacillus silvae]MCK6269605.1 CGNR zinc finger domain-containing protein [Paenibacillus silvae]